MRYTFTLSEPLVLPPDPIYPFCLFVERFCADLESLPIFTYNNSSSSGVPFGARLTPLTFPRLLLSPVSPFFGCVSDAAHFSPGCALRLKLPLRRRLMY